MKRLALALVLAACKSRGEAPPPPEAPPPVMPASEAKRGKDACHAFVAKVCACAETTPPLVEACKLARPLVDALDVALEVAANPESARRDALQANATARKIVKECIEETAKLPGAGCP